MGGWRYLAQREIGQGDGGELLDVDLPLRDVTFTDVLSGPSSLTGTIAPEFAKLKAADGKPLLTEWGTSIWAEEDGNIIGGGFLVDSRFRGPVWSIDCMGYAGYLSKIPYLSSWSGVQVDPLDVVRLMWEHARTQIGGDIGLTVSSLTTPLKIGTVLKQVEFDTVNGPVSFEAGPAKLNWWTTQDLGQEFDKYAKETPFDYHERHQWEGDVIKHYLDFAYPRMGRRINDLRFVIGENVHTSPEVLRTGSDYASEIFGIGAGEGRTQVATRIRANTGRVRRVHVHEDKSARSLKSLNVGANAEMAWRKNIDAINEITLIDHPHAPMGSVKPGDEILLEGNTGWTEISMWLRVLSTSVRPADGNAMTLAVTPADRISS